MTRSVPPVAHKNHHTIECHGDVREDEYLWLRDRQNDAVLQYLRDENEYYKAATAHTAELKEKLFTEMRSRIKEEDTSVPYKRNGYWYITKYQTGKEYPVYTRKKDSLDAGEELLFDGNAMAKGHEFFDLRGIAVSPDNTLAAYGVDTVSRRQYTIRIKDLRSGKILPDTLENTTGGSVWADDNTTLYYVRKDPETLRSNQIFKHRLGTSPDTDELVYQEDDETFNVYVYKSKSQKYIVIGSISTLTSEYRIQSADSPDEPFQVFAPRQRGMEYSIYHFGSHFYILTNQGGATNFKLMRTPETHTDTSNWEEFIPQRDDVLLEDLEIFKEYYVVSERVNGLSRLRVNRWDGSQQYEIPLDGETYVAYPYVNLDFDTTRFRYVYNAMTTPYCIMEIDMASRATTVLKQQEVLGGDFDAADYTSERIWVQARDGQHIPVSLVYRKGFPEGPDRPLLLYGYGSYGSTSDPYFSTVRLSLLDRGFIYAIAHVRGGEYLGRPWYEAGKLLSKWNTFNDFIDCSRALVEKGYTSPEHLYAYGGSAGGLLMGVIVNEAPELYRGVIAAVPFVDVVSTMLDERIPLTTGEYDEWGNPRDPEYYKYIKSYSPYDNVRRQEYPNLLVTAGLHDSQVQYWEPAKWVARLRDRKTDSNQLYLYTNLEAGHGGASGRFEALRETARDFAFLLDLEGKTFES